MYRLVFFVAGLFFLSSCDSARVFEDNISVTGDGWKTNEPMVFSVEIEDTLSPCSFFMNIRHNSAYPYSNIYVFLKTQFPDSTLASDTAEFILQGAGGKWLGSGLGDLYDNQIRFKKGLRFPQRGRYTFTIEQAMREETLPGIKSIGLRIESDI